MSEFPKSERVDGLTPSDNGWNSLTKQSAAGDFGDKNEELTLKQLFTRLEAIYSVDRPAYDDETARLTEDELSIAKDKLGGEDSSKCIDACGLPQMDGDKQIDATSPFEDAEEFWRALCFQNRTGRGFRIDSSYEDENRPINNLRLALRSLPPLTSEELREVKSNLGVASQATKPAWIRARIKDSELVETVMSIYQELFRDQPRVLEVWGAVPAMLADAEVNTDVLKRATYDLYNLALRQVGSDDVDIQIGLLFGKDAADKSRSDKIDSAYRHLAM